MIFRYIVSKLSTTSAYSLGQTDGHTFVDLALDADEQNELI